MPKIGDRVLVEATYNASMPFKWNATRIQMLNSPLEQQVGQPSQQQQQHHAMKMQQLKVHDYTSLKRICTQKILFDMKGTQFRSPLHQHSKKKIHQV